VLATVLDVSSLLCLRRLGRQFCKCAPPFPAGYLCSRPTAAGRRWTSEYTRGAPTGFVLTDIASGRLFRRTKTLTTGPVSASGTYSGGTPNAIELQVLKVFDNSVVISNVGRFRFERSDTDAHQPFGWRWHHGKQSASDWKPRASNQHYGDALYQRRGAVECRGNYADRNSVRAAKLI
jgi:hypothetical protein